MKFSEVRERVQLVYSFRETTRVMNLITNAACELCGSTRYCGAVNALFTELTHSIDLMNCAASFLSIYS